MLLKIQFKNQATLETFYKLFEVPPPILGKWILIKEKEFQSIKWRIAPETMSATLSSCQLFLFLSVSRERKRIARMQATIFVAIGSEAGT